MISKFQWASVLFISFVANLPQLHSQTLPHTPLLKPEELSALAAQYDHFDQLIDQAIEQSYIKNPLLKTANKIIIDLVQEDSQRAHPEGLLKDLKTTDINATWQQYLELRNNWAILEAGNLARDPEYRPFCAYFLRKINLENTEFKNLTKTGTDDQIIKSYFDIVGKRKAETEAKIKQLESASHFPDVLLKIAKDDGIFNSKIGLVKIYLDSQTPAEVTQSRKQRKQVEIAISRLDPTQRTEVLKQVKLLKQQQPPASTQKTPTTFKTNPDSATTQSR